MKLLFCGSFKFLDEMKKLSKQLNLAGFECILPKFSLGDFPSKKIEKMKNNRKENGLKNEEFEKIIKVTKWFYDRLIDCDAMIVFDKDGYVGLSAAAEIGATYVLNKPVFFLESPNDFGIRAILEFSENFKVVPLKNLVSELKRLKKN
ncbi:MAG: hypothetical protein Q8N87_01310 [bacterium]|nr:hypothetical protein [bacterium]